MYRIVTNYITRVQCCSRCRYIFMSTVALEHSLLRQPPFSDAQYQQIPYNNVLSLNVPRWFLWCCQLL